MNAWRKGIKFSLSSKFDKKNIYLIVSSFLIRRKDQPPLISNIYLLFLLDNFGSYHIFFLICILKYIEILIIRVYSNIYLWIILFWAEYSPLICYIFFQKISASPSNFLCFCALVSVFNVFVHVNSKLMIIKYLRATIDNIHNILLFIRLFLLFLYDNFALQRTSYAQ